MTGASDIAMGDWIDRFVPAGIRPYLRLARLDRPIGTWLLLFPCWWSVCLAAAPGQGPDLRLLTLFAVGAIVMRGAGCTINDIADRDFDAKVARTANRPLASGALSLKQAFAFLGLQLGLGLLVLLQFPLNAIWLGVASLVLVAAYPFMKRITWWPQAFLGLTFNWGALLGWAAVTGGLSAAPVWLYAGGIFWTLFYDTIYAHQDKADDALIGIKSTALRLGTQTKPWLFGFGALTIVCFSLAMITSGSGWIAYIGLAGVLIHLFWQLHDVDLDDAKDCLNKFRSNRYVGWILLFGIVLDRLIT
ncbi:4-hydroxybenzoate octaprenyltransferase [Dongia sp.]|uniref:4-hydroxybenzoate octaprenyltransferase n=1 Tax=Dongia sp. TaxID=1977262 RepID=UPI0035B29A5A